MEIYDKIKEIAKAKGMHISAVEKAAGLGNATISKWNGRSPTVGTLKKVADVLGVTLDEIVSK